jgi:LPS O-antigen subunit length determinant protein (WzzB/FepE family)
MNTPTTQSISPPTHQEDEIDLFELGQTIWSQKILIASITISITLLALLISMSLQRSMKLTQLLRRQIHGKLRQFHCLL